MSKRDRRARKKQHRAEKRQREDIREEIREEMRHGHHPRCPLDPANWALIADGDRRWISCTCDADYRRDIALGDR